MIGSCFIYKQKEWFNFIFVEPRLAGLKICERNRKIIQVYKSQDRLANYQRIQKLIIGSRFRLVQNPKNESWKIGKD